MYRSLLPGHDRPPSVRGRPSRARSRISARRPAPRIELLESRLAPATFSVVNLADSGAGSLRQALLDANAQPDADVIQFAPAVVGTITLSSALPILTGPLDIQGPGAKALTLRRDDSAEAFRLFTILPGGNVTLSGLTLTGGRVVSAENFGLAEGGAVLNQGALILLACVLSDNIVSTAGASYGGAVSNRGSMVLDGCTVAHNEASTGGSILSGAAGGGIVNFGTLVVRNSTVADNFAAGGTSRGGGLGGGIYSSGTTIIEFSTITGNSNFTGAFDTPTGGGGIRVVQGTTSLRSSVVAGNTNSFGTPSDLDGAFSSAGYNVIGMPGTSTGLNTATDQIGSTDRPLDARLGPLQDNGGPTPTVALRSGSPAVDAGAPDNFPMTDQRGAPRPVQGGADGVARADVGAFEAPVGTTTVSRQTLEHQQLVSQMYLDLLGRPADPVGLVSFVAALDAGVPANNVAGVIVSSSEYLGLTVQTLYQQYLGRPADPAGLAWHVGLLAQGTPVEEIAAGLLASPEYYQTQGGGTDAGFLRAIYLDVLGRPIDEPFFDIDHIGPPQPPAETTSFNRGLVYLGAGGTRHDLALYLLTSSEGRTYQMNQLYQKYLGRAVDDFGLTNAIVGLQSGQTLGSLTAGIVGSAEYAART